MSSGSDASTQQLPVADRPVAPAPAPGLTLTSAGDTCVNCGAPLASDQRYCVNCGERRGKPRFTLAEGSAATTKSVTTSVSRAPRRPRASAGFNLIAGVATLLLAMGVGVLIGHNSNAPASKAAAQPTFLTVPSAGSAAVAPASSAGGTGGSSKSSSGSKSGHKATKAAAKQAKPTKVVIQKAAAAASKVVGGDAQVAAPTVKQGQSCDSGSAGCQGGKFTGGFFGQ